MPAAGRWSASARVVGPVATNVHVLADARSREAIAIDTAIPSLAWIADELAARDWTLKLIVSTHGHWDHIGDNAAVAAHTGAEIAVHPLDRDRLEHPQPLWAPFEIPPSRAGGRARRGRRDPVRRDPAAGPPHAGPHARARSASTRPTRACCSAATRCSPAAGAGSTCPAATRTAIVESLVRLSTLEDPIARAARPRPRDDDRARAALAGARPASGRRAASASAGRGYGPLTKPVVLTTSNIEPVIPWRSWRSSSSQRGSGAPGDVVGGAVVGEDHPVALQRGEDHPRLRPVAADVDARLEAEAEAHRRVRGARRASPRRGGPGRCGPLRVVGHREPQRVGDRRRRRPRRSGRGPGRSAGRRRRRTSSRRAGARSSGGRRSRRSPPSSPPALRGGEQLPQPAGVACRPSGCGGRRGAPLPSIFGDGRDRVAGRRRTRRATVNVTVLRGVDAVTVLIGIP